MLKRQPYAEFEKAIKRISFPFLSFVLLLFQSDHFESVVGKVTNSSPVSCGNIFISYKDSLYFRTIVIDGMEIEVLYTNVGDSVELEINVLNTGVSPLRVGITSTNTVIGNNNITETVLPDINLLENIELIDLHIDYSILMTKSRFAKLNDYKFIFYVVNDWTKFIKCVSDETKIVTSENDNGQSVIELNNDKMPEEGITIIALSNISYAKKLSELSCQVTKY